MENKLKEGEILFADGRIDEAEDFFLSAIEHDANNKEAYNNLGVIAIRKKDVNSAIECFSRSLEIDPFYKDAIINYADLLSSLNQLQIAKPLLEKVVGKYPGDKEITNLLKIVSSPDQDQSKIAVLCLPGLESFLKDIVDFLKTRYEVRVCYSTTGQDIESAIMWSDIVWLEWANELTIKLTSHPTLLEGKHVICRLHSYEALAGFATNINWKNICDLIFVAEHIKNIVLQQVPSLPDIVGNIHVVPNGIDMNKFSFKDRSRGRNLAYIGNVNFKKGPMLLLHAFRELVQKDDKYRLFVAGDFQDARYQLYFDQMIKEMGLEDNLRFDGWVKDINSWLGDKQYIVCTSILEGHPVGIMEAMTRGLKPLIHNFVGARGIYPEKYIWNTIPEFIDMATEDNYDSMEYRKFIETNYSLEKQLESIDTIITQMCKEGISNSHSVDKKIAELEVCS
jgi:tetratricopeptide (TPR) repeat protein